MTIERLLAFLGYDMNCPVVGRSEAVDDDAMRRLTAPRRASSRHAKAASDAAKADAKADDEMKDEEAQGRAKKK